MFFWHSMKRMYCHTWNWYPPTRSYKSGKHIRKAKASTVFTGCPLRMAFCMLYPVVHVCNSPFPRMGLGARRRKWRVAETNTFSGKVKRFWAWRAAFFSTPLMYPTRSSFSSTNLDKTNTMVYIMAINGCIRRTLSGGLGTTRQKCKPLTRQFF